MHLPRTSNTTMGPTASSKISPPQKAPACVPAGAFHYISYLFGGFIGGNIVQGQGFNTPAPSTRVMSLHRLGLRSSDIPVGWTLVRLSRYGYPSDLRCQLATWQLDPVQVDKPFGYLLLWIYARRRMTGIVARAKKLSGLPRELRNALTP